MSINKYDSTTGDLIPIHSGEVMYADSPIGTILSYGGTTAPSGFLLCNGAAVSRTTYGDLFAVIGTSYGAGDGSTTFNIPNLQGRVAVGYSSSETEFNSIGKTGGEKTHVLSYYEMPKHSHAALYIGSSAGSELGWTGINGTVNGSVQTGIAGDNQAHNNIQPYVVTNYIIKAKQSPMPADMQGEVDDINGEITQIKSDLGKVYRYTFTFNDTDTNRTSLNKLYATLASFDPMSIRDAKFELNFGSSGRGSDIYRLERAAIDKSYYEFIVIMTLSTGIRIVERKISNGTSSASDTKIETTGTSMNDVTNSTMGLSGEYNLVIETI